MREAEDMMNKSLEDEICLSVKAMEEWGDKSSKLVGLLHENILNDIKIR